MLGEDNLSGTTCSGFAVFVPDTFALLTLENVVVFWLVKHLNEFGIDVLVSCRIVATCGHTGLQNTCQ